MKKLIDINRKIYFDDAPISIFNAGFQFGIGIYETILIKQKVAVFLEDHLERLRKGFQFLEIGGYEQFEKDLNARILNLYEKNYINTELMRLKWMLTPNELHFPQVQFSGITEILILSELLWSQKNDFRFYVPNIYKNSDNSLPPYVKITSNNKNLIAAKIAQQHNCDEALLFDDYGTLCEGSYCNIFVIKNNKITTPALDSNLLAGITRQKIIEVLSLNKIPIEEDDVTAEQLIEADEIFLTSSTRGICSIKTIIFDSDFSERFLPKLENKIITYGQDQLTRDIAFLYNNYVADYVNIRK